MEKVQRHMVIVLLAAFCAAILVGSQTATAAEFPEKGKQIRMIITHGLGGSVDTAARGVAPYLEKNLGVPVVPENMVGAGGRRAMQYVFKAAPDGCTIVVSAYPSRLLGELLYPDSAYKMKEFVHLGSFTGGDSRTVIVAKDSPYRTFADLMEAGKKKKLKAAGGGGLGSTSQLQAVLLRDRVGMNVDFIPYKSGSEVTNAIIGKHVDFGLQSLPLALRFAEQGEIRVLAIHSKKRAAELPDVPTMLELGYKGVAISMGVGAWAPPKTPKEIQMRYDQAITQAIADPQYQEWAKRMKVVPLHMGPEEFLQTTLEDYESFAGMVELLKADAKRQRK